MKVCVCGYMRACVRACRFECIDECGGGNVVWYSFVEHFRADERAAWFEFVWMPATREANKVLRIRAT